MYDCLLGVVVGQMSVDQLSRNRIGDLLSLDLFLCILGIYHTDGIIRELNLETPSPKYAHARYPTIL